MAIIHVVTCGKANPFPKDYRFYSTGGIISFVSSLLKKSSQLVMQVEIAKKHYLRKNLLSYSSDPKTMDISG